MLSSGTFLLSTPPKTHAITSVEVKLPCFIGLGFGVLRLVRFYVLQLSATVGDAFTAATHRNASGSCAIPLVTVENSTATSLHSHPRIVAVNVRPYGPQGLWLIGTTTSYKVHAHARAPLIPTQL